MINWNNPNTSLIFWVLAVIFLLTGHFIIAFVLAAITVAHT